MKNKSKMIITGIVICLIAIFVVWFAINNNSAERKYGTKAVEDAKGAIFTADQYLDGTRDKKEYDKQMIYYSNDNVGLSDETYDIYQTIKYMKAFDGDADILKYRNELADLVGEKKR